MESVIPSSASVWTYQNYSDLKAWHKLSEPYSLVPSGFVDRRITFLSFTKETPQNISSSLNGEYNTQTWTKNNCSLVIEGDSTVYISFPDVTEIIKYTSLTRLPVLPIVWKPIVFLLNPTIYTVRITEDIALLITRENPASNIFLVQPINYNDGFACVHPCSDTAYLYGSYAVGAKPTNNTKIIPSHSCEKGKFGFFAHFFPWGTMINPKRVELKQPPFLTGLCTGASSKSTTVGYIFYPPNITIPIQLQMPSKTQVTIDYGRDYLVTCKKIAEYELEITLLIYENVATYNFSFDLRINKVGSPPVILPAKFGIHHTPEAPKWVVRPTKDIKTILSTGVLPEDDMGHLISSDLIAVYNAEIGEYAISPQGKTHSAAFKKQITTQETQTSVEEL